MKEGKKKMMMHDYCRLHQLTVPIRCGLTKVDQRKNEGSQFLKKASPCTRICIDRIVGSRQGNTGTSLASCS